MRQIPKDEKELLISGELASDPRFEEWHQMNSLLIHDMNQIRVDYPKALKQRKNQCMQ